MNTATLLAAMRGNFEVVAIPIGALAGYIAYRVHNRFVRIVGGIIAVTMVTTVTFAGGFVFPLLWSVWRRKPRQGFGIVLAATLVLTAPLLHWRMPWPRPMPAGPTNTAAAIVEYEHLRTTLGGVRGRRGEHIPKPYQRVDLRLALAGRTPVVLHDTIDAESMPGLTSNQSVVVVYPVADPTDGRILGATRTFAEAAFVWFMEWTYALAVVLIVLFELARGAARVLFANRFRSPETRMT